ncbi:MAG: hypothetical protein MZV64_02270 [Ignavibacteriales bacterium]|nr:hypothetical protein [Ignavibacteriales bacterium]
MGIGAGRGGAQFNASPAACGGEQAGGASRSRSLTSDKAEAGRNRTNRKTCRQLGSGQGYVHARPDRLPFRHRAQPRRTAGGGQWACTDLCRSRTLWAFRTRRRNADLRPCSLRWTLAFPESDRVCARKMSGWFSPNAPRNPSQASAPNCLNALQPWSKRQGRWSPTSPISASSLTSAGWKA